MALTWSPCAAEALGTSRSAATRVAFCAFAAVFVAALGWHVAGIDGAFLCDDYGNLNAVFSAAERGALWTWVFSLLHQPLGNASNAFRPMQYVSSALDWLAFGASPIGWRASTIALFFGNAVVGGFVARRWLRGGSADAATGGIFAACLLAAYPFAGEVAYYPGGRADALACLFSLLYLWTLPVEGSSTGRSRVLRIAWFVCALLSKESAALMAAVATMLCIATAAAGGGGAARLRLAVCATARETWPSWLTLGVYLAWRGRLFDSAWKVYVASTPPRDVSELLDRLAPFRFLVKENIGPHYALWAAAAIALFALMLVLRCLERGAGPARQTAMIVALGCSAAMYFVAPAISFPVSGPNGEGARHFYPAWMCMSLLCGMFLPSRRWGWAPGLVLVLAMFAGQAQSLAQWRSAAMEMSRVVASVESFVAGVSDEQYALLLLPDHRGIALFARNAGGLVVRPTQRRDYLSRMTVMLGSDFEPWSQHLTDGVITKLKYGAAFDPANFLGLYCWNPSRGSIVPLTSGAVALDARAWRQEAERNFVAAGCLTPFF